jgi:hypothetical protein
VTCISVADPKIAYCCSEGHPILTFIPNNHSKLTVSLLYPTEQTTA